MPVTLTDVRALLERALTHTENPAILRLPRNDETVSGLAEAYLPYKLYPEFGGYPFNIALRESVEFDRPFARMLEHIPGRVEHIEKRDPATIHAVVVALTLASGRDPGVRGVGVALHWSGKQWYLFHSDPLRGPKVAPLGIHEENLIPALRLAVRQVLEAK